MQFTKLLSIFPFVEGYSLVNFIIYRQSQSSHAESTIRYCRLCYGHDHVAHKIKCWNYGVIHSNSACVM